MTSDIWDIVCEEYLKGFREKYLTLHLRELPLLKQKEHLAKLEELLNSSEHFTSIFFEDNKLQDLIVTEYKNDPFEGRIVKVRKLYSSDIEKSFHLIKDFYKHEKRRFLVDIKSSDSISIKTLEKMGFKRSGSRLVAKVGNSLRLIHEMELKMSTAYLFRRPLIDELEKVVEIELDVHAHEPTSVLNSTNLDQKEIKNFCEKLIREKKIWGLYKSQELIGFIGYGVKDESLGYIANIAVSRSHQGSRLSYHLYKKVLAELQDLGILNYYGFSATHKVLKQADKLGRAVFEFQYECRVAL